MLKSMQEVLEYGFEVLNKVYFGSALPPLVITIINSKGAYGHFTVGKVWRAESEHLHEINISAEHLYRPIENIMATLLHEMVHYYCQLNNIADTSKNGRYHNKNFKREAELRGLSISYEKYIGYSVTKPTQAFVTVLKTHGIEKPLDINRDGEQIDFTNFINGLGGIDGIVGITGGDLGTDNKKKTSTRKYQCPCCGNSFRATKDIRVLCMECNEEFIKVEKK